MWSRVRWGRVVLVALVGLVVGYYAGGWSLGMSIGLGFLIGGLVFELWFWPWQKARLDRRFDAEEKRHR